MDSPGPDESRPAFDESPTEVPVLADVPVLTDVPVFTDVPGLTDVPVLDEPLRSRRRVNIPMVLTALATLATLGFVGVVFGVSNRDRSTAPAITTPAHSYNFDQPAQPEPGAARSAVPSRPARCVQSCPASARTLAPASPSTAQRNGLRATPVATVSARYEFLTKREGSFTGRITVLNLSGTAQAWEVVLGFPPGVAVFWVDTGSLQQTNQRTRISGPTLGPGEGRAVAFAATRPGDNVTDYQLQSCTVNGQACG